MDFIKEIILLLIGAIIPATIGFLNSRQKNKTIVNLEKEKADNLQKLETLKNEYNLNLQELKSNHEKEIMSIKHEQEMELEKYKTELNTNSAQGINEIMGIASAIGIDLKDMTNNPEKVSKQINNLKKSTFLKNKK